MGQFVRDMAVLGKILRLLLMMAAICSGIAYPASQRADASSNEQIAYIRNDGNIWLAGANGSNQHPLTEDGNVTLRQRPVLSHDGQNLAIDAGGAWASSPEPITIWHLNDSRQVRLPNTGGCFAPEFNADDSRIIYKCLERSDLNPAAPVIVSSALDGSDQHIDFQFAAAPSGMLIDIRPSDRLLLVEQYADTNEGQGSLPALQVLDDRLETIASFEGVEVEGGGRQPLFGARLAPDGDHILATVCVSGCAFDQSPRYRDVVLDFDGRILETVTPDWLFNRDGYLIAWRGKAAAPPIAATPAGDAFPSSASTAPASGAAPQDGGLIAFVGDDGNILLMQADGGNPIRLTEDGDPLMSYGNPAWSHDGSMLAFDRPTSDGGREIAVWLLDEDRMISIANSDNCTQPLFAFGDTRLLYNCSETGYPPSIVNPGNITSSSLDTFEQQVPLETGAPGAGALMDVRSSDGAILTAQAIGQENAAITVMNADFTPVISISLDDVLENATGPWGARFVDDDALALLVCATNCGLDESAEFTVVIVNLDGTVLEERDLMIPHDRQGSRHATGLDVAPDGDAFVASFFIQPDLLEIGILTPDGDWAPIGSGADPVWQPEPLL